MSSIRGSQARRTAMPKSLCFSLQLASLVIIGAAPLQAQFSGPGFGIGNTTGGTTGAQSGLLGTAGTGGAPPGTDLFSNNVFGQGLTVGGSSTQGGFGTTGGIGGVGGIGGLGGIGGGLGGFGLGFGIAQGASRGGLGGNRFNMQQGQQGQQGQTTIRASIKLGFDVPRPSGLTRANNIADRLSRIPFATDLSSVNLQVAGDTVVLSGTVDSSDTARKLEGLLMLEPGVYNVRNELQVLGEGAINTPPPPSTTENDVSEVIAVPPPLASPRSP